MIKLKLPRALLSFQFGIRKSEVKIGPKGGQNLHAIYQSITNTFKIYLKKFKIHLI